MLDVIVDLRVGSPGFGQWESVYLDDKDRRTVLLPDGLGHGFMARSEQATIAYLCSTPYAHGREHGVHPLDPGFGIGWPLGDLPGGLGLAAKDANAHTLAEALKAGALPDHNECRGHGSRLGSMPALCGVPYKVQG